MVSNRSPHKAAAIELVRFLTSPQVQRFNAVNRGYAPTRPDLYEDPAVLVSNPFFGSLTGAEWGVSQFKHVDHHLRQFGA